MLQQLLNRSSAPRSGRNAKGGLVGLSSPGLRQRLIVLDSSSTPGDLVIQRALEREMPPTMMSGPQVNEPAQMSDAWKDWVAKEKLQRTKAVVGVPPVMTHTFLRQAGVTRAEQESLLRQVVSMQSMKAYLSNPEVVHFNVTILDQSSSSEKAVGLVVAAKKDLIRPRQDAGIESGLLVERCEFEPVALWNLATMIMPEAAVRGLGFLLIGEEQTSIVTCNEHGPQTVRSLGLGVETLIREIAASEGSITPDLIRRQVMGGESIQDLYPTAFETWGTRLLELISANTAGSSGRGTTATARLEHLFVVGDGAIVGGLGEYLNQEARSEQSVHIEVFNPFVQRGVTLGPTMGVPEQDGPLWVVPLALAAGLVEG